MSTFPILIILIDRNIKTKNSKNNTCLPLKIYVPKAQNEHSKYL